MKKDNLLLFLFWGFCLIIYLNLNGVASLVLNLDAPFSMLLLPICISLIILNRTYISSDAFIWLFIIFLFAYLFISISMAGFYYDTNAESQRYFHHIRGYLPTFITVFSSYLIFKYTVGKNQTIPFIRVLFFCCLFTALLTVFAEPLGLVKNYFQYASFNAVQGHRDGGLFINPNQAGVHSNITLVLCLFLLSKEKSTIISTVYILLVPIIFYSCLVTFSKSAILISFLIIILYLIFSLFLFNSKKLYNQRNRLFILLFTIGLSLYLPIKAVQYYDSLTIGQKERLSSVLLLAQGIVNEETSTTRTTGWKLATDRIAQNPITGFGIGSFHNIDEFGGLGVHNVYLMLIGESGLIPICLLLLLIFSIIIKSLIKFKDKAVVYLIVGLMIVIVVQLYGSGHTGLRNQESNGLLGMIMALTSIRGLKSL